MGIDLTLSIDKYSPHEDTDSYNAKHPLGYDRLSLNRHYDLFDAIKDFPSQSLPQGGSLLWYLDEGVKHCTEDCYGSPLRFVYAGMFRKLLERDDISDWNRAVITMIAALPEPTRIYLWWH